MVNGEIAVVTNIGLEHTEIFGKTSALIAGEKAGIVKPGAVLVTTLGPRDEAGRVLHARARALGAAVVRARAGKTATIEAVNVAVAGAVLDELGKKSVLARDGRPLGAALIDGQTRAAARLVGRMERVDMDFGASRLPVVFDGAHVPFNLAAVLRDLARFPGLAGPCVAVVALASDKDAAGFLTELKARASAIVCTEAPSASRGRPAASLAALAASLGLKSEAEPEPERAFRRGVQLAAEAKAWLLVTGSLYLVGALRRASRGDEH